MPPQDESSTLTVALLGNPNTGKSTLFNALAGVRQRVGNYPGVTVEKRTGRMNHAGRRWELVDLPGLYSLAPRSRDEMVAVDVLAGRADGLSPVDAVACIVDAANLERNLYLVGQVLDVGLPTVVAVNLLDMARRQGLSIDFQRLQRRLGVPVVPMQANRRIGVEELRQALLEVTTNGPATDLADAMPEVFQREVAALAPLLSAGDKDGQAADRNGRQSRYLAARLLLDVGGYVEKALLRDENGASDAAPAGHESCRADEIRRRLEAARKRLAEADCPIPDVETTARYDWVHRTLEGVITKSPRPTVGFSDRVDRVLTHRVWGLVVFALVMTVVFQAVFSWAGPFMEWVDSGFALLGDLLESRMAEAPIRSLLVDGLLTGVGGVVIFLPQILILFFFIAVLEDCGYMARAAFLMDKMMVRVGLSGKSFIPMLSACACAIPAVMATRVIEDERDRLTTILVAPLMTCSARLPIYALLIAAFIPADVRFGLLSLQGLTLIGLYLLGIVAAVTAALVFKKTILRGKTPPFILELPRYQRPSIRAIAHRVAERGWMFIRCVGTMIVVVSILVWAALYYPHDATAVDAAPRVASLRGELDRLSPHDERYQATAAELQRARHGEFQRQSYLGRAGRTIEPIFKPLGWDWRISCAVLASFPAREVVVATLGVMVNAGEGADVENEEGMSRLQASLKEATWDGTDRELFSLPAALSIMVFFALCAQCAATLAVIKRETNSWRWPTFTFLYMSTLAYIGAFVTYQVGTWLAG